MCVSHLECSLIGVYRIYPNNIAVCLPIIGLNNQVIDNGTFY